MFFTFPEDARWNVETQAVEFGVEIGEYRGVVRVPRRVFQRLLPERPTPERCLEAYYLQRTRFERNAERKLRRRQLADDGNVEISGRDLREGSSQASWSDRASLRVPSATAIEWTARDLGASKLRRDEAGVERVALEIAHIVAATGRPSDQRLDLDVSFLKSPALYKGGGVGPSPTYSYSAAVVEVEVNLVTGWVNVPRVWIAHDIGRAMNPTLARGQVEGGVYMGLGEALMEEQEFRRLPKKLSHALVHKFPSILEYKSPTSLDMPEVITELIEVPDPCGPFGAKEVGQGPLLPIMPAVANAVYDAVGVRIDEIPVTPEKIMKALAEKKAGRDPRYGPTHFPHVNWPEALRVPPPWEGGDGNAVNDPARREKPRREKEKVLAP